jgi:hypothetical protein
LVAPAWWPDDWKLGDTAHPRWEEGGCITLALALHDLTGWTLHGVNLRGPHYVVVTPNGLMMDHLGARAWPYRRGGEPMTRAEIVKLERRYGPRQDFPDAPPAAMALLADYFEVGVTKKG